MGVVQFAQGAVVAVLYAALLFPLEEDMSHYLVEVVAKGDDKMRLNVLVYPAVRHGTVAPCQSMDLPQRNKITRSGKDLDLIS